MIPTKDYKANLFEAINLLSEEEIRHRKREKEMKNERVTL